MGCRTPDELTKSLPAFCNSFPEFIVPGHNKTLLARFAALSPLLTHPLPNWSAAVMLKARQLHHLAMPGQRTISSPNTCAHLMCSTNAAWRLAALCTACSSSACPPCSRMLALYSGWNRESTRLRGGAGRRKREVSTAGLAGNVSCAQCKSNTQSEIAQRSCARTMTAQTH